MEVMTRRVLLVVLAAALAGCSLRNIACGGRQPAPPQADAGAGAAPARPAADPGVFKIAFLGDSLTAGLGLLSDQSYPAQIQKLFEGEGYDEVEIINGGISGDTTAGALRRVEGMLEPGVRVMVVALGGNDALRGLTTAETHDNLAKIIQTIRGKGVNVILCGMEAPTNLGEDYRTNFRDLFTALVRENAGGMGFVPFLLEGVAGNPALNQADLIHPNAEGARVIAQALYPKLRTIVDSLSGGGGG
jgi:acyl-CoA thioesterase-1